MTDEKRFMTTLDVSEYLQIHPITVSKLFKKKKLPGFKVGGRWRTRQNLIDAYLLKEINNA